MNSVKWLIALILILVYVLIAWAAIEASSNYYHHNYRVYHNSWLSAAENHAMTVLGEAHES